MLTLDENHIYRWNGNIVPSVTQVLSDVGLIDDTWFTEESRERGTAVHLACQYLDENDLNWSSVDPQYKGYIEAYKKFLKECAPSWETIEDKFYDNVLEYAGTRDRTGFMFGNYVVLDIKAGIPLPWHNVQLAAYHVPMSRAKLYGLYLKSNGNYKLIEYKLYYSAKIFKAALAVYKWKNI